MILTLVGAIGAALATELPSGPQPEPVPLPHFPSAIHAYVWRNWQLVSTERLAEVVGAQPGDVVRVGRAMGLAGPPAVTDEQSARLSTTIIRRNWHLLPYEQLLALLGWTEGELAYHLREDDFLYIKLGRLKPHCTPIAYQPPDEAALAREREMAATVAEAFPGGVGVSADPPLGFVERLSRPPAKAKPPAGEPAFSPRYCHSYFGLTGDPLLDSEDVGYPDGLLARMAASGVDGVWLSIVLYKLAPLPWEPELSEGYEQRLETLRDLVARAKARGIGVYLYLNEPRAMPLAFFEEHPELKGVTEGDYATLCTSAAPVQEYLRDAVTSVAEAVPDLKGFFSISASENLTSCWSHHRGADCPRCSKRKPEDVIAEVNTLFREGIRQGGDTAELIVWDWGWKDEWAEGIINGLPRDVSLQSVSEWSIPIVRGGISTVIGEYSISEVGPGPRATRHWGLARARGFKTVAKIQAGSTWELSTVPYIPAVANVAQHAANLRETGVEGLMLGWTLGGCPSPNLEVVAEMGRGTPSPDEAMLTVARRRFGEDVAPRVVEAWREFSAAFAEFPYHGSVVYNGPQQLGPANLLWEAPTGYSATMVGFPYDHLDGWRAVYPPEVFVRQFDVMARGFKRAVRKLRRETRNASASDEQMDALREELAVAEACALHFRSVANQARFVMARADLQAATTAQAAEGPLEVLERILEDEIEAAVRLQGLQSHDSRLGFEASNQYSYVSVDLAEKVLNCRDLLDRWLPAERRKHGVTEGD